MTDQLFYFEPQPGVSLQMQIQEMLVSLILAGHLAPGSVLPSSRKLAQTLKVSRNTVVLVYARLTDEGYLVSQEREGHFVSQDIASVPSAPCMVDVADPPQTDQLWESRLLRRASSLPVLDKPRQWHECSYSFIYGQLDPQFFPAAEWRDCSRQATSSLVSRQWFVDSVDADDPLLLQQLRTRVLPRRGIRCNEDEILVTLGTQNSLYLLAQLLSGSDTLIGIETPGYLDAHSSFRLAGARLLPLPVDEQGLVVDQQSRRCDYLFVTPSHQYPTTVTMSLARRKALLEQAALCDQIIIEDDYESEIGVAGNATPALKSLDRDGRVLYVGSLSKTLAPGLRMGYLVGPPSLIREARALRRLILRHPPANNQRTLALFLAGGYHDSLIRRLSAVYSQRRERLLDSLQRHFPALTVTASQGGSALWCELPEGLDAAELQRLALERGVIIEAVAPLFFDQRDGSRFVRLGYSVITTDNIPEGVRLLAEVAQELRC